MSIHNKSLIVAAIVFVWVTAIFWLMGTEFGRDKHTALWFVMAPGLSLASYFMASGAFGLASLSESKHEH